MRSIRSPFSLHKKNQEKYMKYHQPPLVDVIGTYFDGQEDIPRGLALDYAKKEGNIPDWAGTSFTLRIPRHFNQKLL